MALSHSRSEFRKELLDSCKPLLDNDNKIHLIPSTSLSSDNFWMIRFTANSLIMLLAKYYDTDTGTHNNPSSRLVSIDMMGCSVDRLASVLDLVVRHDESNTTWEALYDAIVLIFDTAETPLARASSIIDREAQKASQSAFWKADRFQNSRSPSSFLLQKLRDYYSIYAHDRNYVAPYASLVGPSGIGKSFAIKEMATQHNQYVVYLNLSTDQSAYPPRSLHAGVVDTPGLTSAASELIWTNLIRCLAIEVKINHDAGISARDFFLNQITNLEYCKALGDDLKEYAHNDNVQAFEDTRKKRVMALCSPQEFNTPTMQKQFETSDMNDCSFILCIDEARTLLRMYSSDNVSQFVSFRNGARHAFGKCSFFAILLDTTSHVSNFAPAAKLKPSQRTPDYAQLFPPIYAINTFDAFADPEDGSLPVFDATEISAIRLFKLGRPLWGAFLDNGASLRVTQDLARTKLGPADDDDFPLVLMAHRISIQASDYALADFLVSRCMRYIFYINPSRSLLWTHYASEPILAFQAARAMRTPARRLQALQRLVLAHSRGSVDLGDVGEMIAAIILLWTMDSFMEKSDFPSSVAVHRFLEALLGTEVAKKMHISIQPNSSLVNIWENGKIYFNHVCRSLYHDSRSFPSTLLRQAYRRGAAVFFPRNFAGADIGIPVALPGNKFTAILIQVKNRVDGGTQQSQRLLAQDSIRTAQRVISGLGDCMGLMMSLYREREKGRAVVWPDKVARVSPRFIESQPSTTTDIFTALIAGLNHDIYPSVCPAGYQEREQIFELLRVLRDHDPIHRLRECDDQSLRMVNNIFFGVTEPHQDPMDLDP